MKESKRQKQIGGLIQEEINAIFRRMGMGFVEGAMVSISSVKMTPDLLEARIYLSIFQAQDPEKVLNRIRDHHREIKKELAAGLKQQLRRIPELKFFADDTLDHVFRMEEIFRQIRDDQEGSGEKPEEGKKDQ